MDAESNERVEDALKSVGESATISAERLEELKAQFEDPAQALFIVPTEEEVKEIEALEKTTDQTINREWLETDDGKAYVKALKNLYARDEVKGNPELDTFRDKFLDGVISKDEFESAFSAVFTDILKAKNEERERLNKFYTTLGIKWFEYGELHEMNDHIHPDMDLATHYVSIKRDHKGKITSAHVHKRLVWPDGTPRMYLEDMPVWEQALYAHFFDLMVYHDDGSLNVEMTVALHEDYYARKEARRIEKYGRYKPLLPSTKVGRNKLCPCGSGIKYKKCHLDKPAMFATSMEDAQKHFGKDFFDYQAPQEEVLTND